MSTPLCNLIPFLDYLLLFSFWENSTVHFSKEKASRKGGFDYNLAPQGTLMR